MLVRDELGGIVNGIDDGDVVCRLVHMSDMHIMDTVSPARCEWVELLATDPAFKPLIHMHRPYETLTLHALAAHIERLNEPDFTGEMGSPCDLVISTGDNIDNAQRNELDAYLALMLGGVAQLTAHGGVHDSGLHSSPEWQFWLPDTGANAQRWQAHWPDGQSFTDAVSEPILSPGIPVPWTSVMGNHDVLRQGTAITNDALEAIAVGAYKGFARPSAVIGHEPLCEFVECPDHFSGGPGHTIRASADRRAIDVAEWIDAHHRAGAAGYDELPSSETVGDTVIDLEHVRIVILDTNHPDGDYQGSVGIAQLAWLEQRLTEVDQTPGRLAVMASHHGSVSLTNTRGERSDRLLADALHEVVARHQCVVAWLVGHRHINLIQPRPSAHGGYWEITTCSVIDYPSQMRSIDVKIHRDGTVELVCTMIDHWATEGSLAVRHRDLASANTPTNLRTRMAGSPRDTNVRLLLPARIQR